MKRRCTQCGSDGPFYQSRHSWCIYCQKETALARYHADQGYTATGAHIVQLRRAYATPEPERTRRQRVRILQAQAPEGQKVCTWCWEPKPRTDKYFTKDARSMDGYESHCRTCRCIMDRLRTHRKHYANHGEAS